MAEDSWPEFTDDEWARCCAQVREVPFTYRHMLLHFKFLHLFYYTPARLCRYGIREDPSCASCGLSPADFLHLVWTCDSVRKYWLEVFWTIGKMVPLVLDPNPYLALLGDVCMVPSVHQRCIAHALLLAKRRVALLWMASSVPRVSDWVKDMVYCSRQLESYWLQMPAVSRPRDKMEPLRQYLLAHPLGAGGSVRGAAAILFMMSITFLHIDISVMVKCPVADYC